MYLNITEQARAIKHSLAALFSREIDTHQRRQRLIDEGFHLLFVPEHAGGFGAGGSELAAVAAVYGHHRVGAELLHEMICLPLLAEDHSPLVTQPQTPRAVAWPIDNGLRNEESYHAKLKYVVAGDSAQEVLIPLPVRQAVRPLLLASSKFNRSEIHRWYNTTSHCDLSIELHDLGADTSAAMDSRRWGAILLIAHACCGVGMAQAVLDLSVRYSAERRQFGQTINAFQAVQHLLAELAADVEFARSSAHYAVLLMENDTLTFAAIKALCLQAINRVLSACKLAIQIHGAIATTEEYIVGHYLKDAAMTLSWAEHICRCLPDDALTLDEILAEVASV
ncbi:hypothetical protein HCU74_14540 [Spongiibacter sp. KMU-166]|uniref:Acyl-CoA dehydrogenase/oxidase C-terminal domain-containing protein n=1 Tax=Spongiibacter thalassae TaxID=2721624 RepID=A0ABX1GIA6_9GAMM|nr:acyl-CoA dehydrogenase family protein [Spongiibacter thalassae]NKI18631.1 hypothetical protein [Spongiibacter thalassae]